MIRIIIGKKGKNIGIDDNNNILGRGVHMTAWIIYFREAAVYNRQYIQLYREEGFKLGIEVKLILVEELKFGVSNHQWFMRYRQEKITYPDFVISRAIYPLLSRQFELMGIRVFNNSMISEICNDKARTYQFLTKTGIKMVDSNFYRNSQVKEVLSCLDHCTVIKAVEGHGGNQVFLVEPSDVVTLEATSESDDDIDNFSSIKIINEIMNGLGNSDVVVQPFTGSRNQDLRVYVIGKEIVAAVLRTAKEGFKSNFSLGGEIHLYPLSEDEKALINIIINQFDFGLVGIDFIIGDEGELIFNEIEDVVGARMLYQCSDINIVGLYLSYMKNEMKSPYA